MLEENNMSAQPDEEQTDAYTPNVEDVEVQLPVDSERFENDPALDAQGEINEAEVNQVPDLLGIANGEYTEDAGSTRPIKTTQTARRHRRRKPARTGYKTQRHPSYYFTYQQVPQWDNRPMSSHGNEGRHHSFRKYFEDRHRMDKVILFLRPLNKRNAFF